ncbi:MAG: rRNA (uracil1498-N3)-methyltransferase [Acidimicrobiaceae bacterium]|nr:rRNA (uracil1498-N3)-methyltransferase [Acidimicrobiaceae bacterium]
MFVADLERPELDAADRHHLDRVLRLRPGEEVTASDGVGGWRRCEYAGDGRVVAVGDIEVEARPTPLVTVAFALTKGERPEWTVQKLAEAGVDRIVPMTTGRSVVRWDGEKAARQVVRLRSVARAAAMQSRQVWLPVVDDVVAFAALVPVGSGDGLAGGLAMAQMGGDPPSLDRPFILVGPEGGWDESELALASGLAFVTLGPTVLRAETAAMAAGVLLCGLRAGIVGPG